MGKQRLWLSLAGTGLVAVAAGVACDSESSGACSGAEPGEYFQLQIYNYTSNDVTMRLDGRFIGAVAPVASATPGYPGEALLGEFPICDKTVIDGRGSNNVTLTKVCATQIVDSQPCQAVLTNKPYCWLTGNIVQSLTTVPSPIPSDTHENADACEISAMNCDSAGTPGLGSLPCFNACLGMWTSNC